MMAFAPGLSGCFKLGESTTGELDQVDFAYSTHCLFGCSLDQPLMAGTTETLTLSGEAITDDITVSSSAPEIAGFRLVTGDSLPRSVEMVTRAPGQVSLQVHKGNDLLDLVTFSVREPRAIRLEVGEGATLAEAKVISLEVEGEGTNVVARVTDINGEELRADSGLVWSVDAGEIVALTGFLTSTSAVQTGGFATVTGVAPGQTTLRVKAGDTAGQSLSLEVVE